MLEASRHALTIAAALLAPLLFAGLVRAGEEDFAIRASDGFRLEGKLALPEGRVSHVIILLHGSGPSNMDADLSGVTRNRAKNLVFKDMSDALCRSGWAVIRYHKRSFQVQVWGQQEPKLTREAVVKALQDKPLETFIEDAKAAARQARARFPRAKIAFLGHSQGTYVALQAAKELDDIAGVALVGFYTSSLDTLLVEQLVYRSLIGFDRLDADGDGALSLDELKVQERLAVILRQQATLLDLNKDGKIGRDEFSAGNFSNLLDRRPLGPRYHLEEARRPRSVDIVKEAGFKVAFYQGEWDNQTPVYAVKAVELINKMRWKKDNLSFRCFPKLGHALDHRESYDDIRYDLVDREALAELCRSFSAMMGVKKGAKPAEPRAKPRLY